MTEETKHPGGRPSKYRREFVEQARKLCQLGARDIELADFFEVSLSTLNLWKVQHEEFSDALKSGKAIVDDMVEQSLVRRALGYSHDAVKINVSEGTVIETPYTEHYPPDVTACIFWLKNRKPAEWRDKTDVNHGVQDNLARLMEQINGRTRGLPNNS